ncbi:HalOD1 output domain-containing protein [Natronoarchaeum rubrum]|uniref:HalOD1 output domain-containing protein n=1 Tax=Natronoarchaeum rubrum TaxID=755311 RepID=UPI002111A486|nr:HalOD1 output domain-containing protein [Natronoarchaeum rubrum]
MTESDNGGTGSADDPALNHETNWQQVAQRLYEPDRDGDLTTAIVFALAEAEDVSPNEMKTPPLYDSVDVAGIEQTFFGLDTDEGARQGTGTVEFRYTEYLVKVRSDGWIQIYESSEPEPV